MSELIIIVEGQTEQTFIRDVLADHLSAHGVYAHAWLVGKPGRKGGNSYASARRDVLLALKQRADTYCTTMFDYFGLMTNWPKYDYARKLRGTAAIAVLEEGFREDIQREEESARSRFIPYIQLHEFESLLFSAPEQVADALDVHVALVSAIVGRFGAPESINTNRAPASYLKELCGDYIKTVHGPLIAHDIGVEKMRGECPHFAAWLSTIEGLGVAPE